MALHHMNLRLAVHAPFAGPQASELRRLDIPRGDQLLRGIGTALVCTGMPSLSLVAGHLSMHDAEGNWLHKGQQGLMLCSASVEAGSTT